MRQRTRHFARVFDESTRSGFCRWFELVFDVMSSVAVLNRIAAMEAEFEALVAEPLAGLSSAERTAATHEWERFIRRLPAVTHRLVAALAEVPSDELGELDAGRRAATLLRISKAEAHCRIHDAEDLGPRAAITGCTLSSRCCRTHTAAAQQRGDIGTEHVQEHSSVVRSAARLCRQTRPARRPRLSWPSSLAASNRRSCARRPIGWRSCSTRTANCPMVTGRDGAT